MDVAKVTSKGQLTIPKRIRERLGFQEGDLLAITLQGDAALIKRLSADDDAYLGSVEATLNEWQSPEDELAWRDL